MRQFIYTLLFLYSITNGAQSIANFSIDNGGASTTVGNLQVLYTIGEVNLQELNGTGLQVSEGFINGPFRILTNPKVYLQGASLTPNSGEESLMRDDLRVQGILPLISPYSDALTAEASVFNITGDNAIVDWVFIELRDATDNTLIVDSQSGLLQRDGDVVGVDGVSALGFTQPAGNYHVVISHRNHLGIMSANTISLNGTTTVIDLTDGSVPTFGNNAQTTIGMPTGILGMWTGDVDEDRSISFMNDGNSILFGVLFHPDNASFSSLFTEANGYLESDVELNSNTSFQSDLNRVLFNVLFHPENTTFSSLFSFNEQLPTSTSNLRLLEDKYILEKREYMKLEIEAVQKSIKN